MSLEITREIQDKLVCLQVASTGRSKVRRNRFHSYSHIELLQRLFSVRFVAATVHVFNVIRDSGGWSFLCFVTPVRPRLSASPANPKTGDSPCNSIRVRSPHSLCCVAGMLLMGFLLRNIPVVTKGVYINYRWSASLRNIALAVILARAGLGLDPTVCICFCNIGYLPADVVHV